MANKRFYFQSKTTGKCGNARMSAWKYTDQYATKKALKKHFGNVDVYTEEQVMQMSEYWQNEILNNALNWN